MGQIDKRNRNPCPICGRKPDWCRWHDDGWALCMHYGIGGVAVPPGWRAVGKPGKNGGQLFEPVGGDGAPVAPRANKSAEHLRRQDEIELFQRRKKSKEAAAFWKRAKERGAGIDHPRVRAYFEARGIPVASLPDGKVPSSLRFLADCPHPFEQGLFPTVVAAVIDPHRNITMVQRIYLDPAGANRKAEIEKKTLVLGSAFGGACRLSNLGASGTVIICEGVETAAAVLAAVGDRAAVWAGISSAYLHTIALPPECNAAATSPVRRVIIAGDSDKRKGHAEHGAGEHSARICVNQLRMRYPHIAVGMILPTPAVAPTLFDAHGQPANDAKSVDWNDVLKVMGAKVVSETVLGAECQTGLDLGHAPAPASSDDPGPHEEGGGEGDAPVDADAGGTPEVHDEIGPRGELLMIARNRMGRARQLLMDGFRLNGSNANECFTLAYHAQRWHEWVSPELGLPRWQPIDDRILEAEATACLDRYWAQKRKHGDVDPFDPSPETVKATLTAAVNYTAVAEKTTPAWIPPAFDAQGEPDWARGRLARWNKVEQPADPHFCIPTAGGIIDAMALKDGKLRVLPSTPRFFSLSCLPFAVPRKVIEEGLSQFDDRTGLGITHIVEAEELAPTWCSFMRHMSQWKDEEPADSDANVRARMWMDSLQDFLGYCYVGDNSLEKILGVIGLPGSGKNTAADAMICAVGEDNTHSVTFQTLASRFDISGLIGKNLLVMNEFRTGQHTDAQAAMDNLLAFTSGNLMRVERKGKDATETARVNGKLAILMNEFPNLRDTSAAIVRRLVILNCPQPIGKADPDLKKRLKREALGIFLWGLDGLIRVLRRRAITETSEGAETKEEIRMRLSPMSHFVRECSVVGAGQSVVTDVLLDVFRRWAKDQGNTGLAEISKEKFGSDLKAVVRVERKLIGGRADRKYAYVGIRLTDHEDYEDRGDVRVPVAAPRCYHQDLAPSLHGGTYIPDSGSVDDSPWPSSPSPLF